MYTWAWTFEPKASLMTKFLCHQPNFEQSWSIPGHTIVGLRHKRVSNLSWKTKIISFSLSNQWSGELSHWTFRIIMRNVLSKDLHIFKVSDRRPLSQHTVKDSWFYESLDIITVYVHCTLSWSWLYYFNSKRDWLIINFHMALRHNIQNTVYISDRKMSNLAVLIIHRLSTPYLRGYWSLPSHS